MNLIRKADELAKEFRENCVEKCEITIATNFKRSDVPDDKGNYSGTYWDFEGQRNCFIEDAQEGIFKLIYEELDSFLKDKGHEVEPLSDTYMVLARKFVLAKIQALGKAQGLLNGETYTYSNDKSLEEESLLLQIPPVVSTQKNRVRTIAIQKEVNKIAKEIMDKHPLTPRYNLAEEIADILVEEDKILNPPKLEAIRKKYLTKYPNF